jgi:hypothetical protein
MQVTEDRISLLAKVVATEPNPTMDIMSIGPLGGRETTGLSEARSLVKLGCHLSGTCLPFYAVVTWPDGTARPAGVGVENVASHANAKVKPIAAITMRVGTHAMLVMDDKRSHVQVSVVSLENGNAGERIRVASQDRKQVYVAEVIGANLLKRSY